MMTSFLFEAATEELIEFTGHLKPWLAFLIL